MKEVVSWLFYSALKFLYSLLTDGGTWCGGPTVQAIQTSAAVKVHTSARVQCYGPGRGFVGTSIDGVRKQMIALTRDHAVMPPSVRDTCLLQTQTRTIKRRKLIRVYCNVSVDKAANLESGVQEVAKRLTYDQGCNKSWSDS